MKNDQFSNKEINLLTFCPFLFEEYGIDDPAKVRQAIEVHEKNPNYRNKSSKDAHEIFAIGRAVLRLAYIERDADGIVRETGISWGGLTAEIKGRVIAEYLIIAEDFGEDSGPWKRLSSLPWPMLGKLSLDAGLRVGADGLPGLELDRIIQRLQSFRPSRFVERVASSSLGNLLRDLSEPEDLRPLAEFMSHIGRIAEAQGVSAYPYFLAFDHYRRAKGLPVFADWSETDEEETEAKEEDTRFCPGIEALFASMENPGERGRTRPPEPLVAALLGIILSKGIDPAELAKEAAEAQAKLEEGTLGEPDLASYAKANPETTLGKTLAAILGTQGTKAEKTIRELGTWLSLSEEFEGKPIFDFGIDESGTITGKVLLERQEAATQNPEGVRDLLKKMIAAEAQLSDDPNKEVGIIVNGPNGEIEIPKLIILQNLQGINLETADPDLLVGIIKGSYAEAWARKINPERFEA